MCAHARVPVCVCACVCACVCVDVDVDVDVCRACKLACGFQPDEVSIVAMTTAGASTTREGLAQQRGTSRSVIAAAGQVPDQDRWRLGDDGKRPGMVRSTVCTVLLRKHCQRSAGLPCAVQQDFSLVVTGGVVDAGTRCAPCESASYEAPSASVAHGVGNDNTCSWRIATGQGSVRMTFTAFDVGIVSNGACVGEALVVRSKCPGYDPRASLGMPSYHRYIVGRGMHACTDQERGWRCCAHRVWEPCTGASHS